ncbi:hypothetical protein ACHAQJ_005673 [Trichoderma viride]
MARQHGVTSPHACVARGTMQNSASAYLAAFWGHTDIYDFFAVQCRYVSTSDEMRKKKKTKKRKPSQKEPDADKGACKDTGAGLLLNQGFGLTIAHNFLLRELLKSNVEVAKTLVKNTEVLDTLLGSHHQAVSPFSGGKVAEAEA